MDAGDVFTLYTSTASPRGTASAVTSAKILMQYEAASSSARLGSFVWREIGARAPGAGAPVTPSAVDEEALRQMMEGTVMTGYFVPRLGEPIAQRMNVWFDLVEGGAAGVSATAAALVSGKKGALYWAPERAPRVASVDCSLPIDDITDVVVSKKSRAFRTGPGARARPGCCVTLVAKGGYSMNFEAASKEALTRWTSGLAALASASGKKMSEKARAPVAARGVLPVHLISDVFLGMQSAGFHAAMTAKNTGTNAGAPLPPPAPADEDSCFTLVSSRGLSLDLEGASPEDTQQWLRRLSAIINDSGKDIVLAAETDQSQSPSPSPTHTQMQTMTMTPVGAATTPKETAPAPAHAAETHWKVSAPQPASQADFKDAATVVAEAEAEAKAKAGVAAAAAAAQSLMLSGCPFLFHYLSQARGELCHAQTTLSFVAAQPGRDSDGGSGGGGGGGGSLVLRADSPCPAPSVPYRVLSPAATDPSRACVWESRIALEGLSDVYVGSTHGLFASEPALAASAGRDSSRCVSLVSDSAPRSFQWDLEAPSGAAFVDWLNAFNAVLQGLDQEVAVAVAEGEGEGEGGDAGAGADGERLGQTTPLRSDAKPVALDSLRRGAYFYLYESSAPPAGAGPVAAADAAAHAGATSKKLILMFYNDDPARPLHPTEQLLLAGAGNGAGAGSDPSQARTSLFYRYVARAESPSAQAAAAVSPLATDSCVPVASVSDFLLGRATPLMCHSALASLACNDRCFSLVLGAADRPADAGRAHELGLECVEADQMAAWLEGIMEVSNQASGGNGSGDGDGGAELADPSIATTATATAASTPHPQPQPQPQFQAHKPAPLQLPDTPAGASITTMPFSSSASTAAVATPAAPSPFTTVPAATAAADSKPSPRPEALGATDPSVQLLQHGCFVHAWEDYEAPRRARVFLFWAHAAAPTAVATAAAPATGQSAGGALYWNYAPEEEAGEVGGATTEALVATAASAGAPLPAADSPLWTKSPHRRLTLEAVQSIYLGTVAAIFQRAATAAATATGAAAPAPRPSCVLSLLADDDLLNAEWADGRARAQWFDALRAVVRASLGRNLIRVELGAEDENEAGAEWYNVQEGVFPLQLAATAAQTAQAQAQMQQQPGTVASDQSQPQPQSPNQSQSHALEQLARGMDFESWSFVPAAAAGSGAGTGAAPQAMAVQRRPITLFFQQTPEDSVVFFVWVERPAQPPAAAASGAELRQARAWARSIRHSRELAQGSGSSSGAPSFPHLAVSAISDLHIGKNLPIFTAPLSSASAPSRALLADECVSIVASAEGAAGSVASAATAGTPAVELHLVATRGIAQVASVISAVTALLELDGVRLAQPLWDVLRAEEHMAALPVAAPVAVAAAAAPVAAAPASVSAAPVAAAAPPAPVEVPQLVPLRKGGVFWLWKFASEAGAASPTPTPAQRHVSRRQVLLRWLPNDELGELHWSTLGGSGSGADAGEAGAMGVSSITDFLIGAEAAPFAPGCLVASRDPRTGLSGAPVPRHASDESCFSILSCLPGAPPLELHLETETPDVAVVNAWVHGLSVLLQSGGRSLTEEPAASALQQSPTPPQQDPAVALLSVAPVVEAATAAPVVALVASLAPAAGPSVAHELTPLQSESATGAATVRVHLGHDDDDGHDNADDDDVHVVVSASTPLPVPAPAAAAPAPLDAEPTLSAPVSAPAPGVDTAIVAQPQPQQEQEQEQQSPALPPLSTPPTLTEVLGLVRALHRAALDRSLASYSEAQLDLALASIRDAAVTQPRQCSPSVLPVLRTRQRLHARSPWEAWIAMCTAHFLLFSFLLCFVVRFLSRVHG